jgi:hypothetical protein
LLDRQLVALNGRLAGKVDDLELTGPEPEANGALSAPVVVAILSGPGALGPRLGGRLASFVIGTWKRLHPDEDPQPERIAFEHVIRLSDHIELDVSWEDVSEHRTHQWISDRLISRIPRADHAAE